FKLSGVFAVPNKFVYCLNSLKELLRAKLIECGWKDQLKAHCKDVIKEKGLEHVTVDDLVAEITPKGRALVPDSVKKELLQRIRTFLAQHASL
ncbi:transcription and mRNA export factor ENY2-like, partial [Empidonax traillii]|uniref:transcription and mRNA export factor ENY2-like n=1 Tax=Empidonax traillii TaxID=164674 RepID=UPI000FFCF037